MKTFLQFKRIDIILQVLAILYPIVDAIIEGYIGRLLLSYPAVAVVQLFSCLAHLYKREIYNGISRRLYNYLLLIIAVITFLLFLLHCLDTTNDVFFIFWMAALVILTPAMAIWYFITCCAELVASKNKPH